jgi:hypothetical protein
MHVETNILFTVYEGAPFRRWWCLRSQPTPKGAPSYDAITTIVEQNPLLWPPTVKFSIVVRRPHLERVDSLSLKRNRGIQHVWPDYSN